MSISAGQRSLLESRIPFRQHVVRPVPPLPVGNRCLGVLVWYESGSLHELQSVHVAGAVRQHVRGVHAHEELRARVLVEQRIAELEAAVAALRARMNTVSGANGP